MSSSILQKNSSFKKLMHTHKNNNSKSKGSGLLLTEFNKFPVLNQKAKTTKKKTKINHETYSNNSIKLKHKNSENDINDNEIANNINYIYEHIGKKIGFKLINKNSKTANNKKLRGNNNIKNIDILDNNAPKHGNESVKCNSVNNLIGININVNYMNKNYSIKKLKHNSKISNYDNSYNIYNNNSKVVHNNNNIINNNSFNEINSGNLPNSSSSKTKINKKNIFILNPINSDWEKMIENLKSKKTNKSKINIKDNIKSEKLIQNFIHNNNINILADDNILSKTNNNIIEKSSSCKNINHMKKHKEKKSEKLNKFLYLHENMNKKIKQLNQSEKHDEMNINYNYKLMKIINEYYIEYNKLIDDQYQKNLMSEIFYQINNIISSEEDQIINLIKDKEELIKLNNDLKKKNEELMKNNEDNIKDKDESLNTSSINESSSVNSEELESIRFFDKIIMKKNSFSNIPELSFKKINKNEKNNIMQHKKNNIKKRNSFYGSLNKNNEIKNKNYYNQYKAIKKNSINKNNIINNKNNRNSQLIFHKRKINEKNERIKPNIKSFINIFEKSRNKK